MKLDNSSEDDSPSQLLGWCPRMKAGVNGVKTAEGTGDEVRCFDLKDGLGELAEEITIFFLIFS